MESLSVISVAPKNGKPATGTLIGLHGWGANAQDLASVAPFFDLPDYQFLFPNAPFPHPYASTGRMWYDFQGDRTLLSQSQELLTNWLNSLETTTGVPLSRTVLCGFSQGGAMTLDVGLSLPLAGLVILSGYLHPNPPIINSIPPVLIVHGTQDTMVPISAAQKTHSTLLSMGATVQYQEFSMGHEIQPAVLTLIQDFVKTVT